MTNNQLHTPILLKNSNNKTQIMAVSGLMAAVICVATGFIKLPTPIGYIHLGDGFIFLAVAMLGTYGIASAAVGSALADLIAGYFIYVPGTFIIKGLMGVISYKFIDNKFSIGRCAIGYILAEILMIAGYFIYEIPMYGVKAAAASVGFNCIQGIAGIIIGTAVVLAVAKKFKK